MPLIALPALTDNYIWLYVNAAGHAIVFDPGDAAPVLAACAQGIHPVAVIVTHHHADHLAGVATLRSHYPSICVYGPDHPQVVADHIVGDGDAIDICGQTLQVIAVPGHTQSHLAYYDPPYVWCGDTLFSLGCGRIFDSNARELYQSLQRLSRLPGSTLVCCGHEYTQANAFFASHVDPDNLALQQRCQQIRTLRQLGKPTVPVRIDEELATNPFLRCHCPSIQASVVRQFALTDRSEETIFASLRRWKDAFST